MANKIKYGISKCYYSVISYTGDTPTYATPVALPGAVSLSLEAQGETNNFFADNIIYFSSTANNGYQGDLELALLPDSFRTAVLGEELDATSGVYAEYSNKPTVEFALLFQFEGDESACTASRPATSGSTKEESIEPQTESITITAMPRISDELVKSRCPSTASAYANWFTEVVEP